MKRYSHTEYAQGNKFIVGSVLQYIGEHRAYYVTGSSAEDSEYIPRMKCSQMVISLLHYRKQFTVLESTLLYWNTARRNYWK